ncbi:MAG TPA: hypothetical protein VGM05_02775 [Planctomycetaceae bacterium]|jgi:hypothetical protein
MLDKSDLSGSAPALVCRVVTIVFMAAGLWLAAASNSPPVRAQERRAAVSKQSAAKAPAAAPTPAEQTALDEFHKLYRLDNKDQIIKYIKPPFVAGRVLDRKYRWKDRLSNADHGQDGLYVYCYTFYERDGKLEIPFGFGMSSHFPDPKDDGGDLVDMLGWVVNIGGCDVNDPDQLLKGRKLAGDFIIRPDVSADKVIVALGQTLKREIGLPISLRLGETAEAIVAVRGRIKPPFVVKRDVPLELYAATLQPGKGERDQGTYEEFLKDLGKFIDPNRRVSSEVENPPREKISWHRNIRLRFDDQTLHADREARSVLDHLEEQTGLTFTLESYKYPTIYVNRNE